MKHIKPYEGEYKVGDYVIVTSEEWCIENEILILDYIVEDEIITDSFGSHSIKDNTWYEISENDIIRKLTPLEINAIKYNL